MAKRGFHYPSAGSIRWLVGGAFASVVIAAMVSAYPQSMVWLCAIILGVLALSKPYWRLLVVAAGGLFILQESPTLDAQKLGYFAFVLLAAGIALIRLIRRREGQLAALDGMIPVSVLLAAMVLASALVAQLNAVSLLNWARDSTPYLMLPLLLLVGLDCGREVPAARILRLFVAAGVIAAVGYVVDWLSRRGVSSLAVGKFTLSSEALMAAPFCYALLRAARGPNSKRWLVLAGLIFIAVLLGGARSGLVFLAGFVGIAGPRATGRVGVARLAVLFGLLVVGTALLIPLVATLVTSNPAFLANRVAAALSFLQNGKGDPSFVSRVFQYSQAATSLSSHPLVGTGPGLLYPNFNPALPAAYSLDTPLVTLAKFGYLGATFIALWLFKLYRSARRAAQLSGDRLLSTAIRGFAFVFIADLPFGDLLADKGLSIAVMLMAALVAAALRFQPSASSLDSLSLDTAKASSPSEVGRGRLTRRPDPIPA